MEKTLTIEKNEAVQTKTGKTYHRVLSDGIVYSAWDLEVAQKLRAGTTWVVDAEQKDQFWNIKGVVTQIANAKVVPAPTPPTFKTRDPEWGYNRRAALEKATMLATALVKTSSSDTLKGISAILDTSKLIVEVADEYFRWLSPNDEEEEVF